jgi:hypothetical protein
MVRKQARQGMSNMYSALGCLSDSESGLVPNVDLDPSQGVATVEVITGVCCVYM